MYICLIVNFIRNVYSAIFPMYLCNIFLYFVYLQNNCKSKSDTKCVQCCTSHVILKCNIAIKKLYGIHSYLMNEVGFCPDVSGVLSCGDLSVWGFVLWGCVRTP